MKRKKKVIAIVAIVLAVLTVAGAVAGIVFTQKKTNNEPAGEGLSSTHCYVPQGISMLLLRFFYTSSMTGLDSAAILSGR